jgi:hypothetical protein
VLRGDLPASTTDDRRGPCSFCHSYGDALAGGEATITLDGEGDIARVVLASASPDPALVLVLDIERLGDPGVITPADVGEPARRALALDVLASGGVEAVELGALPPTWALTDASVRTGTTGPPMTCAWLSLDYRDLRAVSDAWLRLDVTTEACDGGTGPVSGEPLDVGSFQGAISASGQGGVVSDGTTRVWFQTDLPAKELVGLLASLSPYDAGADPDQPSTRWRP